MPLRRRLVLDLRNLRAGILRGFGDLSFDLSRIWVGGNHLLLDRFSGFWACDVLVGGIEGCLKSFGCGHCRHEMSKVIDEAHY